MISLAHNFLFVHIPKTAGNAIQIALREYSEDKLVRLGPHHDGHERFEIRNFRFKIHKHSSLSEYESELPRHIFGSLFKFTCVRNPWDRVISFYFSPHRGVTKWDRMAFVELLDKLPSTPSYLMLPGERHANQSPFKNVDYIMRYENLDGEFRNLCKIIGIRHEVLPIRNRSHRLHYSKYYDDELVEKVQRRFAHEIEYFSYEF